MAKKKVVIVCPLSEADQEFLSGVLVVQNMGNSLKVEMKKGMSGLSLPYLIGRTAGIDTCLKGLTGRRIVGAYWQYVGMDLEAAGGCFEDLLSEMKSFAKSLKKGLPDYWQELLPTLEEWRLENIQK